MAVKATKRIRELAATAFTKAKAGVIEQLREAIGKIAKDDEVTGEIDRILKDLGFDLGDLEESMRAELLTIYSDGAGAATKQIDVSVKLRREEAEKWASSRASELVQGLDDATREMLRGNIAEALAEGWSMDELADRLEDNYAFSETRAHTIATTEVAMADVQGNMAAYRASGVVAGKRWIVAQDEYCDLCELNAQAGAIGFDDSFPDGSEAPPAHPNCRCDVIPVLSEEDAE